MATLNARRLDEEVVAKLKGRAAVDNRSLKDGVRNILEKATEMEADRANKGFLNAVSNTE